MFEYAAEGKAHKLVLHCSLQRATGRLFVNATEAHNPANSQVRAGRQGRGRKGVWP